MGPKKDLLNTKDRIEQLKGLKKHLSKEIIEDTFTAADQAYLDLWTSEKVRQIAVLQDFVVKTSQENSQLKMSLLEKETEYGQQITELRTKVNEKCDEIVQLTDANHRLLEERKVDLESYDVQLDKELKKFDEAKEKLTVEIKILNSKLNNLEEFRADREGLIEKHKTMLTYLRDLEERADGIVHVYRRLDVVNKDRMGQELKERLLKLSIEFQEASQTETTRSLIRENIAINNELGGHIGSWQALRDENRELKNQRYLLVNDLRSEESLKEKCLSLNVLQTQVIERLAYEHKKLAAFHVEIESLKELRDRLEKKLETATFEARKSEMEVKLMAQKNHGLRTQINELEHDRRTLSNAIYTEEINLKKALLLVAEGRFLRTRLSTDDIRSKLDDILKFLGSLFKNAEPPSTGGLISTKSFATVYDPDYSEKYWLKQGIVIETRKQSKKFTNVVEVSSSQEEDSSSSEDSD